MYNLGTFTANKVNFIWFFTLILGLDALIFRPVKGASSVIPFKGTCTLRYVATLIQGNRVVKDIENFEESTSFVNFHQ